MAEEIKASELPVKFETILEKVQRHVPRMAKGSMNAVAAMQAITVIESDEDKQKVNDVLVGVRNTYESIKKLREEITKPLDETKSSLMEFEKSLEPDGIRLRNLISGYDQAKIDAKQKIEEEARIQKEKENHKVDIIARIKKNLADMIIERVRQVQSGSKSYFEACKLEDFDAKAKSFKSFKPVLKREEHYDKCFNVEYDKNIISETEYAQIFVDIRADEPYDKYDEAVKLVVIPVLNDWIGRIPDLKQKLIDVKNASDETERKRIIDEQNKKSEEEDKVRQDQITNMQQTSDENINREVAVDKMQNEFREQAMTQEVGDTGPVKLILKFKDEKPVKALTEIMYHCFMSPKFPSIVKVDSKTKLPKMDENGFPVYADWADSLISFFLKNCDVNISGVEIKEIPKVIIRK